MAVSGKRAGVEFVQEIQTPLVNIQEAALPPLVIGPAYQIISQSDGDNPNSAAIALDTAGDPLVYDAVATLDVDFFADDTLEGAIALPSLIDKSAVLPNADRTEDSFMAAALVPPGGSMSQAVQLTLVAAFGSPGDKEFILIAGANGDTIGIVINSGIAPFATNAVANVVVGLRALRRDFSRKPLKTDFQNFEAIMGGTFGPENPVALGLQKVLEVAQQSFCFAVFLDQVTNDEPNGSSGAWIRALDAAGTTDAYSIVPLSSDLAVLNIVAAHIRIQSEPENRKERIGWLTTTLPTREPNNIKLSGTGSLEPVHAVIQHTGGGVFDIIGEVNDGGVIADTTVKFAIIDADTNGLSVARTGAGTVASPYIIEANLSGDTPDATTVVAALNGDPDILAVVRFYVGPADTDDAVPVFAEAFFSGGDDDPRQLFTNQSVAAVAVDTIEAVTDVQLGDFVDLEDEFFDFRVDPAETYPVRSWNNSLVLEDPGVLGVGETREIPRPIEVQLLTAKVGIAYSVYEFVTPGLTITTPLGVEPDRQRQAESMATFASRFANRRIRVILPETAVTTVNGLQQNLPSYFLACTTAGMVASLPSQQPHSELPIPGWEQVLGSNDSFTEGQLEIMTASGLWIYVQDIAGGPIVSRKQYTTDPSGDITAEASITHITDDFVRTVRRSVRPILGRNNLTPDIVERVRFVIQGVIGRFESRQAIRSGKLLSLAPSDEPGDLTTLLGEVDLEFFGPFNLLNVLLLL